MTNLVTSCVLLAACAHDFALMKRAETLHAYQAAIRWSAFDDAATFQSEWAPAWHPPKHLDAIRVTGYTVLATREDKERRTLHESVEIRYYLTTDLAERSIRDEQSWRYDPVLERWVLDSSLPRFK